MNYDYIFITSSQLWEQGFYIGSFLNYLGFEPKCKKGLLIVEHSIKTNKISYNENHYIESRRLFTLMGFDNTLMLNPHKIDYSIKEHPKKNIVKFAIVGYWLKNQEQLYLAIDNLIYASIENFKILIIGSYKHIPEKYQKYVEFYGHLSFKDMYDVLNTCNFLLPMLDAHEPTHFRYINDAVSGTLQLSFGFLLPMCVNDVYAINYRLNDSNAVIYNGKNLYKALKQAIKMSNEDYSNMQNSLKSLQEYIYKTSLDNLNNSIYFNNNCDFKTSGDI